MRYLDGIKTIDPTDAANALILGTALHTGIEKGVEAGIQAYYDSFPVIDDDHVNEVMKLEYLITKVREVLPEGIYEQQILKSDFIGYSDLLVPVDGEKNIYDLYDFKYSNNVRNYMESGQLHEYKYFIEQNSSKRIRNMYFVFIPKVAIKQKKTEDLRTFRIRIMEELKKSEVNIVQIQFNPNKVIEFYAGIKKVLEAKDFPKDPNYLCNWCEYQEFCEKGIDYMLLPKNQRRNIGETAKRKIWIYGASFSGKTTMLDDAPEPLNLNTDGNIQFVTMQYVPIKDEVTVEGRITKRKFAWDVFKDVIGELEKKQNDFRTIIVDLLEDTREMCRIFKYDEMGIQHESDSGYGKGWDIIKTEYLSTIRRLFNLDYENIIVVSHEDVSKDITKKNGQNITRISPNIQDAIANKVAGMVDIVARVVVEDDGTRTLNFKSNEVIFGGGRLKGIKETKIPLSWEALMKVYEEANAQASSGNRNGSTSQTEGTPANGNKSDSGSNRKGRKAKEETPDPDNVGESQKGDFSAQKVQEVEQTEEKTELDESVSPSHGDEVVGGEQVIIPSETPVAEKKIRKRRGE